MMKRTFYFTCGDINGIGPEIILKTFERIYNPSKYNLLFSTPINVFEKAAALTNFPLPFKIQKDFSRIDFKNESIAVLSQGRVKVTPGKPTKESGICSFESIRNGFGYVSKGLADALITAPISKTALSLGGIKFPGHTEMLGKLCKTKNYAMMFLSNKFIAALATIHLPLSKVSESLTKSQLELTTEVVINSLLRDLGINQPKIALLGLNPHAGENGRIGKEEIAVINPVIEKYARRNVFGPFVPDAFFGNHLYKNYDAVIGMYHDQVLIPFKMLNFNRGVNFTAGLPIVRTSPDHGTAFDIAWENKANPESMIEAFKWADKIVRNRESKSNQ